MHILCDHVEVKLKNHEHSVLLDLDDWEYFKNHSLIVGNEDYILYRENGKYRRIHRKIMGNPNGMVIDHINRNKSDNRKCNLRICTDAQNRRNTGISKNNTSGHKGVRRSSRSRGTWEAYISNDGRILHLGTFIRIEDAIKAREEAEIKYYGDFARLELREKMGA